MPQKKPGVAIVISVGKPKPKPDMKKYAAGAMPHNVMKEAWEVFNVSKANPSARGALQQADRRRLAPTGIHGADAMSGPPMPSSDYDWSWDSGYRGKDTSADDDSKLMNAQGDFDRDDSVYGPYLAEQRQKERKNIMAEGMRDPRMATQEEEIPQGRMPKEVPPNPFKRSWDSLKDSNTPQDPSWTPEAIARINAENDEARRALRGGE